MNIPENLVPLFWCAAGAGVLAAIGIAVGITLLLGTVPHRKVALPLVWISATALAAAVTVLIVTLTHS